MSLEAQGILTPPGATCSINEPRLPASLVVSDVPDTKASRPRLKAESVSSLVLPVRPAAFVPAPMTPAPANIGTTIADMSRSAFLNGSDSSLRPLTSSHQSAGPFINGRNLEVMSMTVSIAPATARCLPPISSVVILPSAPCSA